MKQMNPYTLRLAFWTILLGCLANFPLQAQDESADTTAVEATEEAAPEPELLRSRMSLAANQMADGTIELEALLRAKAESGYVKVPDQEVVFYSLDVDANETELAKGKTGANGMAVYLVKPDQAVAREDGTLGFLVRYDGNDQVSGSENEVSILRATLVMEPVEEDSVRSLRFKAYAESSEGPVPIVAAPVSVYVKRMFSDLKIGEGETDENGELDIEFPAGLKGDPEGNLQIRAEIEDTDEYGNLVARLTQPWGDKVSFDVNTLPRALWSPNPPLWMVVAFFVLMVAVWAHYGVIIWKMFRIKAASRES